MERKVLRESILSVCVKLQFACNYSSCRSIITNYISALISKVRLQIAGHFDGTSAARNFD